MFPLLISLPDGFLSWTDKLKDTEFDLFAYFLLWQSGAVAILVVRGTSIRQDDVASLDVFSFCFYFLVFGRRRMSKCFSLLAKRTRSRRVA